MEPAGGDVGRDEHGGRAVGEEVEGAVALVLALVAVDEARRDAVVPQGRVDPARPATRATEDQDPPTLLRHHKLQEEGDLEHVVDLEEPVAQVLGRPRVTPLLDPDRLPQERPGEILHRGGHGRAEERHLAGLGHALEDRPHLRPESHVEHAVALVDHEVPDERETEDVDVHELPEPTRGADQEVDAGLDPFALRLDRRLAPDRGHLDQRTLREAPEFRRDLLCELPGRDDHEPPESPARVDVATAGITTLVAPRPPHHRRRLRDQSVGERDAVGERLPGPGGRQADQVASDRERADRPALDRRGVLEAERLDPLQDDRLDRQVLETIERLLRGGGRRLGRILGRLRGLAHSWRG